MPSNDRREFLKRTAAAAAGLGLVSWPHGARAQTTRQPDENAALRGSTAPELVVVNAKVYTVDDAQPRAEAFAVKHGRFVAVGRTADVRALAGADTKVIDAEGMTVTPGFIDAHTHPASAGVAALANVDCDVYTIAEIKQRMRDRAAKAPAGQWVLGFKYDDTKLKDGRKLNRQDLDEAAPNHPARVTHRGGHTQVANSVALKLAGVDRNTPDPEGGAFGRDEQGELTGFVAEKARAVFDRVGNAPPITRETRQAGVKLISAQMTAAGLTSVHDTSGANDFTAYRDAYDAGELRFRVYAFCGFPTMQALRALGLRSGAGDEWLKIGGLKLSADGSASERTMRMSTPYVGRPNDYGLLTMSQQELDEKILEAHQGGFQVGVHANGDVTIAMVLNAYERALRIKPHPDPRFRLEHCSLINEDLLKRIKALEAVPTPFWTYVHYHGPKWAEYGPEKMRSMFAHRSFLDHGIRVAGASDYVPGPFEPLMAIQSMVTRKDFEGREWGPNQKVTVDEALRIGTINGAYASFEEQEKGSITPGKLADFVMLEQDPHEVDPDRIKNIRVARTVVGGKMMHPLNES
ncbi:MAG: amidohydrolase [Planctomycetales bacterium]